MEEATNDGAFEGSMLHERIYRKMKQDNINENLYLLRKEKLIQKDLRFVQSKISMEKKYLTDKSMTSGAKVRKLEQEDNLIKGKERKKPTQPRGPPHTEKRSRRKQNNNLGRPIKHRSIAIHQSDLKIKYSDDEADDKEDNALRPPPLLPPIYRQKATFPGRSLFKQNKAHPVKVEELYECRYLRLSKTQQLEGATKNKTIT
eukprot:gene17518-19268_t